MGVTWCRACASLMATMSTMAHSCPLLAAHGDIHRIDAHVMPRVASNSHVCGRPSSPPRSSKLCARSAAAHSTTPRAELRS
eukprot:647090-Pleurochrysis_carterae.AAC.1